MLKGLRLWFWRHVWLDTGCTLHMVCG